MAPTLNCTVGDPAANSYVCLDEAEQIAANIPGGDDWIALTEDEKDLQPDCSDSTAGDSAVRGRDLFSKSTAEVAEARRRLRRTTLRLHGDSVQD